MNIYQKTFLVINPILFFLPPIPFLSELNAMVTYKNLLNIFSQSEEIHFSSHQDIQPNREF